MAPELNHAPQTRHHGYYAYHSLLKAGDNKQYTSRKLVEIALTTRKMIFKRHIKYVSVKLLFLKLTKC